MASGHAFCPTVNLCLVLSIYVAFSTLRPQSNWNKTLYKDGDVYFASQSISRVELEALAARKLTPRHVSADGTHLDFSFFLFSFFFSLFLSLLISLDFTFDFSCW